MINIIVACNNKRVIGKDGKIPWHLPNDLKRFKEITMDHSVIMGRKTHESIGKILKGRTNIVISRDKDYIPLETSESIYVVQSLQTAITLALKFSDEVFIIGGAQVYNEALQYTQRLYITHVFNDEDGDTLFPHIHKGDWHEITRLNFHDHNFVVLDRSKKT